MLYGAGDSLVKLQTDLTKRVADKNVKFQGELSLHVISLHSAVVTFALFTRSSGEYHHK